VGDRAGEGAAYANLGFAHDSQVDFSKAIEYHAQDLAMAKEVGDRSGEGQSYGNLGCANQSLGNCAKGIECQTHHPAIAKDVGARAGEGAANANHGCAYQSLGDFSKAIKYHGQHLAIAKEAGDRTGEGKAYANLGNAYQSQGDFSKAIKYHGQHLTIAKEVGDRAGEGMANGNLGTCHMHLNEYDKAVAYFEAQHALATLLKLAHGQSDAAIDMGVALTLVVRAARQGPVAGADQAPGPYSHSSVSACLNDRVREAAFDGGRPFAKLHLSHLTFYAGQEDAALAHLKEHLSWCVQRGRADHQKMASKKAALGGNLWTGRHKDIC